jgi:ubiquinone/menaquinone biosynthesis C-methylase UbiE
MQNAEIQCGDFVLVRKLGAGSFGTTYLIRNVHAESRLHVFKVRNPGVADTVDIEARIYDAMRKRHQNVAELYGVLTVQCQGRKTHALDMEYVQGRTLRDLLRERHGLEPLEAVDYAIQIARGLAYLHLWGIRHRDLKPANVMITDDGVAKLIDFGLATSREIAAQPRMNRAYAPPEFHLDTERDSSDIWSFGLVLYEMVAGHHLMKPTESAAMENSSSFKEYISRHVAAMARVQERLDDVFGARLAEDIPSELRPVISRCLRVDPEARYPHAQELIGALTAGKQALRRSSLEKSRTDYAARARLYGSAVKTYRDPVLRAMSRKLFEPIAAGAIALDIGCGQGDASTCLQEPTVVDGRTVWTPIIGSIEYMDITPAMVEKGIADGRIDPRNIKYESATQRLPYYNETFDYVITRYFIHDLSPEEKAGLVAGIRDVLKPGGKLQVIDMVADDDRTKKLYNLYHSRKTTGPYRQCWIPTRDEYVRLYVEQGFVEIATDMYWSEVHTRQSLAEGQVTEERLAELEDLFSLEMREQAHVCEYFGLRRTDDGGVFVRFPVLLICGTRL